MPSLMKDCKRRDHHVVGHGGQGIAVEELADVLRAADGLGHFLFSGVNFEVSAPLAVAMLDESTEA